VPKKVKIFVIMSHPFNTISPIHRSRKEKEAGSNETLSDVNGERSRRLKMLSTSLVRTWRKKAQNEEKAQSEAEAQNERKSEAIDEPVWGDPAAQRQGCTADTKRVRRPGCKFGDAFSRAGSTLNVGR